MAHEVAALVSRRAEPCEVAIVEHGVEEHDALDHTSLSGRLAEPVVWLADGCPEGLVVDVEHSPAMELASGDRRRESSLDERIDEVRALLAVDDAGRTAVLALDEDTRVQQHVQQESRLAFGEAKRCDGFHAFRVR
jgi:hypothetical protein